MKKISPNIKLKYERIIDEWFITKPRNFNGAQAYRKFYGNVSKDTTAEVGFSRIQALPEMKEYIKAKHEEVSKVVSMTHEGILQELKQWIELDITETIGLSIAEIKLLPIEIRRAFTKHKVKTRSCYDNKGNLLSTEESIEMHFISKERAAEMINKHIGFYEADNKQKTPNFDLGTLSTAELVARAKVVREISGE
jgi:hypothetical protein